MKTKLLSFLLFFILFISCTEDREINIETIENPNLELIHYWDFNDSTNLFQPTFSTGGTAMNYLGASYDGTDGTDTNSKLNSIAGTALRLRNPAGDFTVKIPTLGYKDVVLSYAVMRSGSGAQTQKISYSLDGVNFTSDGIEAPEINITEIYLLKQFNFSGIEGVSNNANFSIKIQFSNGDQNATGNDRIDNFSVEGIPSGDPIPDPNQSFLLHYWNFNALPSGTLTAVNADFSLLNVANANIKYEGSGTGFMDQFSPGSEINLQSNVEAGLGLRFRNPSDTKSVIIEAPTSGHKAVIMNFATARSGSGAQTQNYSYSIDGSTFVSTGLPITIFEVPIEPAFEKVTLDFSGISGVNNNPNFKVKIEFSGSNASGTSGNNRFDNVTFEAKSN